MFYKGRNHDQSHLGSHGRVHCLRCGNSEPPLALSVSEWTEKMKMQLQKHRDCKATGTEPVGFVRLGTRCVICGLENTKGYCYSHLENLCWNCNHATKRLFTEPAEAFLVWNQLAERLLAGKRRDDGRRPRPVETFHRIRGSWPQGCPRPIPHNGKRLIHRLMISDPHGWTRE